MSGTLGNGAANGNGGGRANGNGRAPHESRLYSELSHVYDIVFGRFFIPRVCSLIKSLHIPPGARVLELGVGTGGSLAAYPTHCEVIGVDRSGDMLREARAKIDRFGWRHVRVMEGDATDLPFADDGFDYVMAFHVVSVVTEPHRLMSEAIRVCRPDGLLSVVNRFRRPDGVLGGLERRMEPVTRRWGWHTLSKEEILRGHPLEVVGTRRGGPWGLFTAVVARNCKVETVVPG